MSESYKVRFPISPEIQAFVDTNRQFAATGTSISERRAAFLKSCRHFTPPLPHGWMVEDSRLGELCLRTYKPTSAPPQAGWPVLLYLHGGGWDQGDLDTHDWFAHAIAERLGIAVVAVAYRLAPEHPFPAPLDDALLVWTALQAGQISSALSCDQIVVCGDSAGGSIAAGLCVALRDKGEKQPCGQALVYPVLTTKTVDPSATRYRDAPLLSTEGLAGSIARYLPKSDHHENSWAMPLMAESFDSLAPAFIGVAEFDILRDEGIQYAECLRAAGTNANVYIGKGLIHGSLRARGAAQVEAFYDQLAAAISEFVIPKE